MILGIRESLARIRRWLVVSEGVLDARLRLGKFGFLLLTLIPLLIAALVALVLGRRLVFSSNRIQLGDIARNVVLQQPLDGKANVEARLAKCLGDHHQCGARIHALVEHQQAYHASGFRAPRLVLFLTEFHQRRHRVNGAIRPTGLRRAFRRRVQQVIKGAGEVVA